MTFWRPGRWDPPTPDPTLRGSRDHEHGGPSGTEQTMRSAEQLIEELRGPLVHDGDRSLAEWQALECEGEPYADEPF